MKRNIILVLLSCLYLSLIGQSQTSIDSVLLKELEQMIIVDQLAATHAHPPQEFKELSQGEWEAKKDSIYRTHQKRLEEILNDMGFPGYDKVGKKGSISFWAMTQHADFDPQFQQRVLDSMLVQLQKKNASSRNYALLTDRVNINQGLKQIYGTQVDYTLFTGQAKPLATVDPENLNKRREEVGLQPIEVYLADMTTDNLALNPNLFGITIPGLIIILGGIVVILVASLLIRKKKKN